MATAVLDSPAVAGVVERKKIRPVVGWAALGAAFLGFEIYLLASWIISGDASRQPTGATPVPLYMKVILDALQVALPLGFAAGVWYFIVRPWRRDRRLTTDSLFAIAYGLLWWQDPLADFLGPWSIYNTYPVNFGSWLGRVPGVAFPQAAHLAEPVFLTVPCFLGAVFFTVVGVNVVMRRAQARWPGLSNFRLIAVTFVFFFVFDLVSEIFCVWAGWYTFPGALKSWSLFSSQYVRFPLYEALFMAVAYTLFACVRYFRNDKGETLVERGSDRLRSTGKGRTVVRFLALFGVVNLIYFCSYNLPTQYISVNSDTYPASITHRSYFLGGLCGEGTTYHCPGPTVPIPRGHSAHVGPDGRLVPAR